MAKGSQKNLVLFAVLGKLLKDFSVNIIRLWCTMFKLSNPFIFKVANDFICSFLAFEALSDIVGLRSFVVLKHSLLQPPTL